MSRYDRQDPALDSDYCNGLSPHGAEEDDSWPRLCAHCQVNWVEKPPLPSPHALCRGCIEALSTLQKQDAFRRGSTKGAA